MSPNTRLRFDWWRGSFYQRTCSQPPVATPAVTPGLKGYNCTLRSCGSSGRAGDKGDWGTRRVMKADSKEKEDRQEDFFFFTFFFKTRKWSGKWGTISNSYTWLNFLKHNFTLKQLEGFKTSISFIFSLLWIPGTWGISNLACLETSESPLTFEINFEESEQCLAAQHEFRMTDPLVGNKVQRIKY